MLGVLKLLNARCKFGKWEHCNGEYCGREITQEGDRYVISQAKKIKSLQMIEVNRGDDDDRLCEESDRCRKSPPKSI